MPLIDVIQQVIKLARRLLFISHQGFHQGNQAMYDRRFFASKLGQSAALSIAAMVTFAIFASVPQGSASADAQVIGTRVALA